MEGLVFVQSVSLGVGFVENIYVFLEPSNEAFTISCINNVKLKELINVYILNMCYI